MPPASASGAMSILQIEDTAPRLKDINHVYWADRIKQDSLAHCKVSGGPQGRQGSRGGAGKSLHIEA